MAINTFSPAFKFASIRSPKPMELAPDIISVMPDTSLILSIISINDSNSTNAQKLTDTNSLLQGYIDSATFIRSTPQFYTIVDINTPTQSGLELLYDNLIVRLLTKSNTNEVYALLLKYIKLFAASLNSTTVDKIRIVIPEKITFSFTQFVGTNTATPPVNEAPSLLADIAKYFNTKTKIIEAKKTNIVLLAPNNKITKRNFDYSPIHHFFGKSKVIVNDAELFVNDKLSSLYTRSETNHTFPQSDEALAGDTNLRETEESNVIKVFNETEYLQQLRNILQIAKASNLTELNDTETVTDSYFGTILPDLGVTGKLSIENTEKLVNEKLSALFNQFNKIVPGNTFALIGNSWKNVTGVVNPGFVVEDERETSIMVHAHGCYLKYPVQVADLRIVEQQTVGYLPAEIAHINNTQRGEKNTRVTRRLKKVESFESIITDIETTHETDTQSTERFSIENDAYEVQQEENSWNVNATVSGTYGPISATVNGGYSGNSLEISGNNSSQQYAKEIFTRVVDRVSNRVRVERSLKTIEEFEETVTHEIDNSKEETKSYIYRWLNKLVRGTLKNYGKRLIFEINVAHPSSYFISRMIKEKPQLNIPDDPRELTIGGVKFNPQMIDQNNYLALGTVYKTKLEAPPEQKIIVSEAFGATSGSVVVNKLLPIKKGYACKYAIVTNTYGIGWPGGHQLRIIIGNAAYAHYSNSEDFWVPRTFWLVDEKENLPVSIFQGVAGYIMNIEVHCDLTPEALSEWQTKAYYDLLDAYDKLKAQADAKLNEFDPNAPGLPPEKKRDVIRTELKKEAIRKMFRCNPFWVNDKYQVGKEYYPNCCLDSSNAERVRFLETVFDWRNMTYELHPYFYANKTQWNKILDLEDDDPHFDAFLKASFATVRIPVHRDNLKEIAACNFIINNAVGNYETIPQGLESLLEELATEPATKFTYDLDGTELPEPKTSVDLGIFPVPTSLVILECSNQDGVKPIGFPQADIVDPDVVIPKQYSPAIIADNCDNP